MDGLNTEVKRGPGRPPKVDTTAQELALLKHLIRNLAQELYIASTLRVGAMDTTSRADEVSRQVRQTLTSVAERLRQAAGE